jgi:hypothetical protein
MGILREICHEDDDDTPMTDIEELPSSYRAAKYQARHGIELYPGSKSYGLRHRSLAHTVELGNGHVTR